MPAVPTDSSWPWRCSSFRPDPRNRPPGPRWRRHPPRGHARRAHGLVLAVALLLVQTRPAFADIVRGFVTDEQGKPVFNADFNVYDAATGVKLPPSAAS